MSCASSPGHTFLLPCSLGTRLDDLCNSLFGLNTSREFNYISYTVDKAATVDSTENGGQRDSDKMDTT